MSKYSNYSITIFVPATNEEGNRVILRDFRHDNLAAMVFEESIDFDPIFADCVDEVKSFEPKARRFKISLPTSSPDEVKQKSRDDAVNETLAVIDHALARLRGLSK